ncbi:MAG: alkaline phosphatase D family protein [Planctomycetes bacterium]|nr:alkaline phosphatase D family protein [Planctomycetota bacterium]
MRGENRFHTATGCAALVVFATLAASSAAVAQEKVDEDQHITHGPILGRLSSQGIGVWARTKLAGTFGVRYGTASDRLDQETKPIPTSLAHDNTGWVYITGLKPGTKYWYELFLPENPGLTGRGGSFRTLPDSRDFVDARRNPRGLFNFKFEFACGNNQNLAHSSGPGLPGFATMLEQLDGEIDFAILNGDWLYESQRAYSPEAWRRQVSRPGEEIELPHVVQVAPTIVGVWENYKHFLSQGENLSHWHRKVPSFFTYDDHEMLNDIRGAGSPGLRDRRATFRDIGARAWYDYLAWSNPTTFTQPVHFGTAKLEQGSDILVDEAADFTRLDLSQANNLHVHWGTATAGVNDNALDGQGGVPNAGVYRIVEVLDEHRLKIEPAADADAEADAYSIGRRSYFRMSIANCDFFVCDTRGQRQMHDVKDPSKPGLSMLGPVQRDWLMEGVKASDADFIFVVSSVNFMVPHVGGGAIRTVNKDDAWTVFFDEREKLIELFDSLEKPVFVLTGDLHNSFVIKITDNVWEMASGPHNSNNHWYTDEGDRPANGTFQYGPRPCEIRWSTWFSDDIPRGQLLHPTFCVVQVNNVFDNPVKLGGESRWFAFPRPQVVFQYYDGRTGKLRYAESVLAAERKE